MLIALIGFAHGEVVPAGSPAQEKTADLNTLARKQIETLHRQLKKDAAAFLKLDDTKRHRTRKRLKRLRYCSEFVASLYRAKPVRRYLKGLRPAQDVLGEYVDLMMAEAAFRQQLEHDGRAWFSLGWLAARRAQILPNTARTLKDLKKAPKFWLDAK